MAQALKGIRVFESGRFFAGPLAGTLLGDMGAEVIRFEEPGLGDPLRHTHSPLIDGQGSYTLWSARNKKSITLNLRHPVGQRIFREIAKVSDVVIENFTPGTMTKWGLDYNSLKAVNPSIIMLSVSMYGSTGPYSLRPGVDPLAQAISGIMSITGDPDGPPTRMLPAMADFVAGFLNVYSILVALYHRTMTGQGQWVDNSLMECYAFCMENKILQYTKLGHVEGRKWSRGGPLYRAYPCKDGDIMILAAGGSWRERLFKAIGREDLWDDPGHRIDFSAYDPELPPVLYELDAIVQAWTKSKTVSEAFDILVKNNVMTAPVYDVAGLVNDPQYVSRGALVEVDHPELGSLKFQGSPVHLSATPGSVNSPAPTLGGHNEYVYGELLGYDGKSIDTMLCDGII